MAHTMIRRHHSQGKVQLRSILLLTLSLISREFIGGHKGSISENVTAAVYIITYSSPVWRAM